MVVLLTIAAVYVVICLLVMAGQRRMIYYPTRVSEALAIHYAGQSGLKPWRNGTGQIIGWHLPAKGPSTATILIAHGNAGAAMHRDYLAAPLQEAGPADVYILEYPGYGSREGSPSQDSILSAAEEAFRSLPKNQPIYLVSESVGTGVAAHLAKLFPNEVKGLAMIVPYDKFSSVAQQHMRFLPAGLLLRDRYAPADWLREYRGPAVFLLAGADTIIPAERGRKLHDSYSGPKKLFVIENGGHNDVAGQPVQWWREVFAFWRQGS